MDRFPEAFHRFEKVVDLRSFRSARELKYAFSHWAGRRWINSYSQNRALLIESLKRGFVEIEFPRFVKKYQIYKKPSWRYETVNVRGKPQVRYRNIKNGRFIRKPF
jgi:hypothetical protein